MNSRPIFQGISVFVCQVEHAAVHDAVKSDIILKVIGQNSFEVFDFQISEASRIEAMLKSVYVAWLAARLTFEVRPGQHLVLFWFL
jgi:hypothetical protein